MKKVNRVLLAAIYKRQALPVREVIGKVGRVHKDHRDFFPLVGLISGGYIGTTLPMFDGNYRDVRMAEQLQAISQGPGRQTYKGVTIISISDGDCFYITGKGLEYFATRQSDTKKLIVAAMLSLISGLVVAFASEPVKKLWGNRISTPLIKLETRQNL